MNINDKTKVVTQELAWYEYKNEKPKNMSRVLVSIGGYTQSSVLIYIDGVLYKDGDNVEYFLSDIIDLWCYFPLPKKDYV